MDRVDLNPVKNTMDIFIIHGKGSKLPCPLCRKDCVVYDHLNEMVWRDLDSADFMMSIHSPSTREDGIWVQE